MLSAISEATIQVLLAVGPRRLTTTRVAERAGVSVGTLYQYFPHKQAFFYGLNQHYLDALASRIESACRALHGAPISRMVEALVTTYWNAKVERADVTRVLYRSVVELDNDPLIEAFASASDAVFTDLSIVNLTLLTTIFGTVRSVFERNLPDDNGRVVQTQLILMCNSYLDLVRSAPAKRSN